METACVPITPLSSTTLYVNRERETNKDKIVDAR